MKKLILSSIILTLCLITLGCDLTTTLVKGGNITSETTTTSTPANTDIDYIKSLLIQEGYSLDERDNDSVAYYNTNAVNERYNITVTVTEVYLGYVNQVDRWAEVVGFIAESDAIAFTTAIDTLGESGLLYYREGTVVVITFSQDTIDALT